MREITIEIYEGDLYDIQQAAQKIGSTVESLIYGAAVVKAGEILRRKANQRVNTPE